MSTIVWMLPNPNAPHPEFSPHAVRHKRGPGCELYPECYEEDTDVQ